MLCRVLVFLCILCSFTWPQDEVKAFLELGKTQKPLLIAFLGPSDCPWSQKFKQELLSQEKLYQTLGKEVLFLEIDDKHPQREKFKTLFSIKESPLVLAIDVDGEEMGRFAFAPMSPERFGQEILDKIKRFLNVKTFVEEGDFECTEKELIVVFQEAKTLSNPFYANKICEEGIIKEKGHYFLVERYLSLLYSLPWNDPRLIKARLDVMQKKDVSASQIALTLAVLDFKRLSHIKKEKDPSPALPLLEYVEKYKQDKEARVNLAEEMLAGFFFVQKDYPKALFYVEESLKKASLPKRQELEDFYKVIKECME